MAMEPRSAPDVQDVQMPGRESQEQIWHMAYHNHRRSERDAGGGSAGRGGFCRVRLSVARQLSIRMVGEAEGTEGAAVQ